MKSTHSQRLERWVGTARLEQISKSMIGWHGRPIALLDVPGGVRVHSDGDFSGPFERGYFMSAMDSLELAYKRAMRFPHGQLNAGFASISDALLRATSGYSRQLNGMIAKAGPTGVAAVASTLWRVGSMPAAGSASSAAPGGRAPTSSTVGAMAFDNPASGTTRLVGADFSSSVINNSLLIYDRIFDVAKVVTSLTSEPVTGVPTRYQSIVATDEDYSGDNFVFIEVVSALPATAHTWTVCTYLDQDGNASTLPTVTGNASAIIDRFDQPVGTWFCPLATGDIGVKSLTAIQIATNVLASGAVTFVIGHPLGIMCMTIANLMMPFDWLTNRNQAPRIFDSACVALIQLPPPAATASNYAGQLYTVVAAP